MIQRKLTEKLKLTAQQLPVITILGPRQSGKTTLAQATFNKHRYISLEDLDYRDQAINDPRAFLESNRNEHGMILDEIQHAPNLLSYIQTFVDKEQIKGYFILTGSQNFLINQAITQTLAGRMAIFTLLPLSVGELNTNSLLPKSAEELIHKGCYPRLYAETIDINLWYQSYILTYIERDVRQVTSIGDLTLFKTFLKMCAGRIGQLLNVSSLANDCGIPVKTVQKWLSLLEASYIIFLLQPHYKNFSKRLVKTPKLYFYDTGLACSLLSLESAEQVWSHYLRGGLTENLVLTDLLKQFYNAARQPNLYFWRDNHGHEIDALIEKGTQLFPLEVKAGQTITGNFFKELLYWNKISDTDPKNNFLVYTGTENQQRSSGSVVNWKSLDTIMERIYTS